MNLAHLCGRCPTAVARIWDGVAELRGPLRAQLARRVAATLQAARGPPGGSPFSPSQPQERLQEANLVRERLLHNGTDNRCAPGGRTRSQSLSRIPTGQLPPPTIDPALLRQLLPTHKLLGGAEEPKRTSHPKEKRPEHKTLERKFLESLNSSGRSSWSSSSSGGNNASGNGVPAREPCVAQGHRPNFLPLGHLACSLSLGHATSSSQTSPESADASPVSFGAEIAALAAAIRVPEPRGDASLRSVVVNTGPPTPARQSLVSATTNTIWSNLREVEDDRFIVFRTSVDLPVSTTDGNDRSQGGRYVEGEHWQRGPLLGSGAFSSCYQAWDRANGTLMAVKQVSFCRNCQEEEERVATGIWDEIQMMAKLEHPNVLTLLGATKHQNHYNVFVQWMAGGSVASMLDKYGAFPEPVILHYTQQVLSGLAHLHDHQIVHRDLKGANLLVDSTGRQIKIADFGSATRLSSELTLAGEFQGQLLGTIAFMAPEVLRGENYGRACDIWSVGCVLIEMATNAHPWQGVNAPNSLALIFRISCARSPPPVPKHLSLAAQHLALRCLQLRSQDRPRADDLLQHPCFCHTTSHAPFNRAD